MQKIKVKEKCSLQESSQNISGIFILFYFTSNKKTLVDCANMPEIQQDLAESCYKIP